MKKQITQIEVLSQVRLLLDVVVRSALWMLERTGRNFKPIPELGLSKGFKSCPQRSSQIFFAMEDGNITTNRS